MNSKNKGSQFERSICRQLSIWWTQDEVTPSDAVFWRTSNSGGRASVRTKSGKHTKNQYGDICAIDTIGQPLMDLFTFELKIGYSKHSVADLFDKPKKAKPQLYEKWIEQARKSQQGAGTKYWAIIVKRDRRDTLMISSFHHWSWSTFLWRYSEFNSEDTLGVYRLDKFLEHWTPDKLLGN